MSPFQLKWRHVATPVITPKTTGPLVWLKRVAKWLLGIAFFAIVFAMTILIGLYVYQRYENRPIASRQWPTLPIEKYGVDLALKSDMRGGAVRYQFKVTPQEKFKDLFNAHAAEIPREDVFQIVFSDSEGYELCVFPVTTHPTTTGGKVLSLESKGSTKLCEDYRKAEKWHVRAKTEELLKLLDVESGLVPIPKNAAVVDPNKDDQLQWSDHLAGFDYLTGRLELRSGKVLKVSPGGRGTVLMWENSAELKIDCTPRRACSIENTRNSEIVRGSR
jgi:hypothetical protein